MYTICPDCGGNGYGPDRMSGNEVYQDKCDTCNGEGRILQMTDTSKIRVTPGIDSLLNACQHKDYCLSLERQRDELIDALHESRVFLGFSEKEGFYSRIEANDALLAEIEGKRK